MKRFVYKVSDPEGLHARNAVSLYRITGSFKSRITILVQENGQDRKADCKDMLALMGLRIHQDTSVTFTIEGEDEDAAFDHLTAIIPTIL